MEVVEKRFLVPCSPWPQDPKMKKVGQYMMTNMYEGFRGVGWKALGFLGLSATEIEQVIVGAKRDITNSQYRVYIPL